MNNGKEEKEKKMFVCHKLPGGKREIRHFKPETIVVKPEAMEAIAMKIIIKSMG